MPDHPATEDCGDRCSSRSLLIGDGQVRRIVGLLANQLLRGFFEEAPANASLASLVYRARPSRWLEAEKRCLRRDGHDLRRFASSDLTVPLRHA